MHLANELVTGSRSVAAHASGAAAATRRLRRSGLSTTPLRDDCRHCNSDSPGTGRRSTVADLGVISSVSLTPIHRSVPRFDLLSAPIDSFLVYFSPVQSLGSSRLVGFDSDPLPCCQLCLTIRHTVDVFPRSSDIRRPDGVRSYNEMCSGLLSSSGNADLAAPAVGDRSTARSESRWRPTLDRPDPLGPPP